MDSTPSPASMMATKSFNRRQRLAAASAAASDTSSLRPYSWNSNTSSAASEPAPLSPSASPYSSASGDDARSSSSSSSSAESRSTAPTTPRAYKTPPRIQIVQEEEARPRRHHHHQQQRQQHQRHEDLPPIVTNNASLSSVNTYDSAFSDVEGEDLVDDDDETDDDADGGPLDRNLLLPPSEGDDIPSVLPTYRAPVADPSVRPATPRAFGQLFPSMDRLSVRHDDLTPDGNMNLRVDTVIPGPVAGHHHSRRRHSVGPVSLQLFHLRMHDLARRDFSLRRYCRDSGREVCSSKRAYVEAPSSSSSSSSSTSCSSPTSAHHSISSALRSVKTPFSRSATGLFHRRPSVGSATTASSSSSTDEHAGARSNARRRGSLSTIGTTSSASSSLHQQHQPQLVPTETIKLDFSNYARVEVSRYGDKRYEFEWWGHQYAWRRVVDENLGGAVSFHLVRDGRGQPVAHVVPETRAPNQVAADEAAGGWVPPCHMWISDPSVIDAVTDVADVIVATGLIALVDDCIKQRWHVQKKPSRMTLRSPMAGEFGDQAAGPHQLGALVGGLFHRRNGEQNPPSSPLRFNRPVAAC